MDIARLRDFVIQMTNCADRSHEEEQMVAHTSVLLADLIKNDDWLPEQYAKEGESYRQYLLHCDPLERFSIVSFVWGPGQKTPIHNHEVWGVIGVLRGAERGIRYEIKEKKLIQCDELLLQVGDIEVVSPTRGDIHMVSNAFLDKKSISIHVYGANIGAVRRNVFDSITGEPTNFISGYSNNSLPNLWDLSDK